MIILVVGLYFLKQWCRGGKCSNKHDMNNQFVIITGASSGLGKSTAADLIAHGAKVIYACRNEQNAKNVIDELPQEQRANAEFIPLDLCSFKSIEQFADTIKSKYPTINILINNAGAQPDGYKETVDGLESFIQGNHLGPMFLTFLLLDHFSEQSRIITISSLAHYYGPLTVDSVKTLSNPEKYKSYYFGSFFGLFELYSDSKLMNLYFTQYLAEKLTKQYSHIKSASLHPGVVNTAFFRYMSTNKLLNYTFTLLTPIFMLISKNADEGAQTHLHVCYEPFEQLTSGAYYADCALAPISSAAKNVETRNAIMDWSLETIQQKVKSFDKKL